MTNNHEIAIQLVNPISVNNSMYKYNMVKLKKKTSGDMKFVQSLKYNCLIHKLISIHKNIFVY